MRCSPAALKLFTYGKGKTMKKTSQTANRLLREMREQRAKIQRSEAELRQRRAAAGDARATGRVDKQKNERG
jgi:hypothetical protein